MFREISAWHLIIIVVAFVVLFGYKKLPDATRSLGRSMRIFKSEVKSLHDDEPRSVEQTPAAAVTPVQPVQPVQSNVAPPAQSQAAQSQAAQPQAAPPAQSAAPAASDARAEADRS